MLSWLGRALWELQSRTNPVWRRISPKREILRAVMLTWVLMWLGCRVAARAICFSSRSRTFKTISPTTSTTGRHLEFERDYNSHTAFRGVLRHYA